MNRHEAQEVLQFYRPGTGDAQDPELTAALEWVERDPELAKWFEENCALHEAIRAKFQQISVPAGLKEQILSEQKVRPITVWWRRPVVLAAAVAALLLGLAIVLLRAPPDEDSFEVFRRMMVRTALRNYRMDVETNDLNQIRAYLARTTAITNYVLPQSLQKVEAAGCVALTWHDKPVSMLCFRSGKPLAPGQKSDLFFFAIGRASVTGAPPADPPQFAKVNKLMTASWTQGDRVYLLAGPGDEAFLRKFR
jgi:hypothetical protein